MLFNTIDFAIFLPIVFGVYWLADRLGIKIQNLVIVIASYYFYGCWDWRFLSLIAFSTIVDYSIGLALNKESHPSRRKLLLWVSMLTNLGFLGFFKYYNFFAESFSQAFTFFGVSMDTARLDIILPVGISFYTFQTMSYTIDVYKRELEPTKDLVAFTAFVSFFPQLVAGPIERATNLLPQFYKKREFDYANAVNGMRQILWGLFKKVVIADNCAQFANEIFNNSGDFSGSTLFMGALFFTFQIYGDFSGYSDIAIGTSRLFGFNLMQNFAFPYFSRDIAEFWRRWHISLSTWFRDYLYIPLGGSRGNTWMKVRNTFVIFVVSGFWHGANWTFLVWGFLNAVYFLPLLLTKRNRHNLGVVAEGRILPSLREVVQMGLTFFLTVVAWVFFRAESLGHAVDYLWGMFRHPGSFLLLSIYWKYKTIIALLFIFVLVEWIGRENQYAIENVGLTWKRPLRYAMYYLIIIAIFWFGGKEQQFIYFQF
ncbi:MBOAT family protein [Mangrovimonas sp. AS39]|uniref:MBOAT family O-acyltransferase n=1 Tax=Mangrovimonas futianensis TaxID=2895523 RepID=UPI001E3EC433|nr:MBOAT family O-acyltransferase [Mangrovimonas futianensis]MCF1190807.1 MBOAT family protein [Mangrovimonas futianensis]MCF1194504.1 MBOAT family protein [Mangrovimonas futianensis]